jgi:hypothetical protein
MAAYTIVPIEHNIKQAITAAVKAVEFKKYHVEADEVVDNLLADIFKTLFPNNPALVDVTKVEMVEVPIVPAAAEAVVLPASPAKPAKKPRAKKEKPAPEPVPEVVPGAGAAAASADAAPKKGKAKKEKAVQNLDKVNPTQKKVLTKAGADPKEFLEYVNALTEEEYKAKTFEEHVQNFGKPKVVEEEFVDKELIEVPFDGKVYLVDAATKTKVYEEDGDVAKLIGHIDMPRFKGMVVPE